MNEFKCRYLKTPVVGDGLICHPPVASTLDKILSIVMQSLMQHFNCEVHHLRHVLIVNACIKSSTEFQGS